MVASFPLGIGVRLGREETLEALISSGFYDGGFGGASGSEGTWFGIRGALGAGLDLQRRLSPTVSLAVSDWVMSDATLTTDLVEVVAPRFGFGLGAELCLGPKATFRPSFGGEEGLGDRGSTALLLDGALRRGIRPLPLVQIQIARRGWLDLDYSVRFDPDDLSRPIQEAWIGGTGFWGGRKAPE